MIRASAPTTTRVRPPPGGAAAMSEELIPRVHTVNVSPLPAVLRPATVHSTGGKVGSHLNGGVRLLPRFPPGPPVTTALLVGLINRRKRTRRQPVLARGAKSRYSGDAPLR